MAAKRFRHIFHTILSVHAHVGKYPSLVPPSLTTFSASSPTVRHKLIVVALFGFAEGYVMSFYIMGHRRRILLLIVCIYHMHLYFYSHIISPYCCYLISLVGSTYSYVPRAARTYERTHVGVITKRGWGHIANMTSLCLNAAQASTPPV
ncbi:hypothetical protein BJV78DRAFT_335534 [Lactifluus subvellereus]|nr:hypothetical protein BJV78DRAFT_335534 [Lactifluus subvellereus]